MKSRPPPKTHICRYTADEIFVRERNLSRDLIGKVSFVDMMLLDILGRPPTSEESEAVNIVMVSLMEHGFSPSIVVSRSVFSCAPEAVQGAIAAGLLAAGRDSDDHKRVGR